LRAVEEALAELPASHRAELLSELSERVAARKAELNPEGELAEILDLLADNDQVPASAPPPPSEEEEPVEIAPGRRAGAIAWVLIVAAAMLVMCLAAVVTFGFFMLRASLH
jgi:hypothetical protein